MHFVALLCLLVAEKAELEAGWKRAEEAYTAKYRQAPAGIWNERSTRSPRSFISSEARRLASSFATGDENTSRSSGIDPLSAYLYYVVLIQHDNSDTHQPTTKSGSDAAAVVSDHGVASLLSTSSFYFTIMEENRMTNADSTNPNLLLSLISEGVQQLGRKQFIEAYQRFWRAVCILKTQTNPDFSKLLEAYDYAERAAAMQSREPNTEDASSWMELALAASENSAAVREQAIRASEQPEYEMRGRLLAQLQLLSVEHFGLRNFDKALAFAQRSQKFQEDYREDGTVPMFHLSACGNEAMALFRLGRLDEAMKAVNKALYSWDPETLEEVDGLKCFAKLCEFKATILGALAKKKLN